MIGAGSLGMSIYIVCKEELPDHHNQTADGCSAGPHRWLAVGLNMMKYQECGPSQQERQRRHTDIFDNMPRSRAYMEWE